MLDLEAIKARLEAAPGPLVLTAAGWLYGPDRNQSAIVVRDGWGRGATRSYQVMLKYAPTDIADLIAEVERLRVLPALTAQIEARGWLWECGHSQGPADLTRQYYARLWLPTIDPTHEDYADERIGWGATIEAATQQALEALPDTTTAPPNPHEHADERPADWQDDAGGWVVGDEL